MDTLLKKNGVALEDVLDQEDVVQECKYLNAGLLDFLSKDAVMERLMKYAIESPELAEAHDGDEFVFAKHAFVASEILVVDCLQLLEAITSTPAHLVTLFSVLERPVPLDASVAGSFRKVVVMLVQRGFEQLMRFLRSQRGLIQRMVNHIGVFAVMEVLIMISWDDGLGQVRQYSDTQWLYREGVVTHLLARLDRQYDSQPDVHANASRALVDLVSKGPGKDANLLVTQLLSSQCVEQLFRHMFSGSASSLESCLAVLIQLVQKTSLMLKAQEADGDLPGGPGRDGPAPELSPLLQAVLSHVDRLFTLLKPGSAGAAAAAPLDMQYGRLEVPLGVLRLKAVELFVVLYGCPHPRVEEALVRLRALDVLLDLFFTYKWNNLLHRLVEMAIQHVVDSPSSAVRVSAFRDSRLADRLVAAHAENEEVEVLPGRLRAGNMGHLIRISNGLVGLNKPDVAPFLSGSSKWEAFVAGKLQQENTRQSTVIGGVPPSKSSQHSDEEYDYDEYGQPTGAGGVGVGVGGAGAGGPGGGAGGGGMDPTTMVGNSVGGSPGGNGVSGPRSLADMIQGFITDEFEEEAERWDTADDAGQNGPSWFSGSGGTTGPSGGGGPGVVTVPDDYPGSSSSSDSSSEEEEGEEEEEEEDDIEEEEEEEEGDDDNGSDDDAEMADQTRHRVAKQVTSTAPGRRRAGSDSGHESDGESGSGGEQDDLENDAATLAAARVAEAAVAAALAAAVGGSGRDAGSGSESDEEKDHDGGGPGSPKKEEHEDEDAGGAAAVQFNDTHFWRESYPSALVGDLHLDGDDDM